MDELDELVRGAAPRGLGDETGAADRARFLAQTVAIESKGVRPGARLRKVFAGVAIGIGIVGVGVTAATAGPSMLAWVGWAPEAAVQRSFSIVEGDTTCQVVARVLPEYRNVSDAEADRRTAEARVFLTQFDWERAVESITVAEVDAAYAREQERRAPLIAEAESTGATPPPAVSRGLVAADLMAERVQSAFDDGGYLRQGTSLEMAAECAGTSDGGAR